MITEFQLLQAARVPTVVVKHAGVRQDELPALYDATFTALHAAISDGRLAVQGPPFGLYTRMAETIDVEIGFPGTLVAADEAFEESALPGGTLAVAHYFGAYSGLPQAWSEFVGLLEQEGKAEAAPCWESYVSAPTPGSDPATLRTDLVVVVS